MQISKHTIPGVYIQQSAPESKLELLTGVPLFLGLATARESGNEPRKLTLKNHYFDQYYSEAQGYFRDAVRGFFENGGRLCYAIALAENTLEALQQGLLASETIDDIDLVCAPDIMFVPKGKDKNLQLKMQKEVLEHCEKMGDRFAILDALNVTYDYVKELTQQKNELSSDYGALYAPWLKIEERSDPIKGTISQEAFYVRCDEEINPDENLEVGRVIAEVRLAPTVPGEFIELLLVQSDRGIAVT